MSLTSVRRFGLAGVALALALCVGAGSAEAASIGMNFSQPTYALASGEAAGVDPYANWNNAAAGSGAGFALNSSAGASAVTLDWNAYSGANDSQGASTATPNNKLMSNGLEVGAIAGSPLRDAQFRFNNLNSFAATYDAYVYMTDRGASHMAGGGNIYASGTSSDYTLGQEDDPTFPTGNEIAPTQTWSVPNNSGFASFVQGQNYVKFTGLTADTLVLSVEVTGSNGAAWPFGVISGVQVVGAAAVPEPSTFALAGLGLVGLVGYGLRRRKK